MQTNTSPRSDYYTEACICGANPAYHLGHTQACANAEAARAEFALRQTTEETREPAEIQETLLLPVVEAHLPRANSVDMATRIERALHWAGYSAQKIEILEAIQPVMLGDQGDFYSAQNIVDAVLEADIVS